MRAASPGRFDKLKRYKPYPAYKDPRIEWLGKIPEWWGIVSLKRIGKFRGGTGFPENLQGLLDEDIPFYKVSDTNLDGNELFMDFHNNSISVCTSKELSATVFPEHTIIFAKVGAALLLNKRRILTRPSCIDNNMMGFMPKKGNLKFLFYWMCSLDFGFFANPGAIPSLNEGQLRVLPIPLPPVTEQNVIADFLDRETAKIDALITKQEQLIKLLQEKRAALITNAVTKGLDLDVPMKDSGVEWLGEVPAHWIVLPLKRRFEVRLGKMLQNEPRTPSDEHLPYLRAANITWGGVVTYDIKKMWFSQKEKQIYALQKFDLLISEGGDVGRSALWKNEIDKCYIQNAINRVRSLGEDDTAFLYYWMFMLKHTGYIDMMCSKATISHFTAEKVEVVPVIFPSPKEQALIIEYLNKEMDKINVLIDKIKEVMEFFKEYRTALISAAVTGKIDVRKEVPCHDCGSP